LTQLERALQRKQVNGEQQTGGEQQHGALDVNAGTAAECLEHLRRLPRVSDSMAERIVALRPFKDKADLISRVNADQSSSAAHIGEALGRKLTARSREEWDALFYAQPAVFKRSAWHEQDLERVASVHAKRKRDTHSPSCVYQDRNSLQWEQTIGTCERLLQPAELTAAIPGQEHGKWDLRYQPCCCWCMSYPCPCPGTVAGLLASDRAVVSAAATILATSEDGLRRLCEPHLSGADPFLSKHDTWRKPLSKLPQEILAAFPHGVPERVELQFHTARAKANFARYLFTTNRDPTKGAVRYGIMIQEGRELDTEASVWPNVLNRLLACIN